MGPFEPVVVTIRGVGICAFAIESSSSRGYGSGFREIMVLGLKLPARGVFVVGFSGLRASLCKVPEICVVAVSTLKVDGAAVSTVRVSMLERFATRVSKTGMSFPVDDGIGRSDI